MPTWTIRRFMLQTRNGKRTAKASVTVAVDMVKEGMLTEQEALLKIKAEMMDFFLFPSIDPKSPKNVIAKGLPASPGAKSGMIVFNPDVRNRFCACVKLGFSLSHLLNPGFCC